VRLAPGFNTASERRTTLGSSPPLRGGFQQSCESRHSILVRRSEVRLTPGFYTASERRTTVGSSPPL